MAAINREQIKERLWPGIKAWFGLEYKDYPVEYREIFTVQKSDKAYEEIVNEAGFGLASAKESGKAITYDEASTLWTSRFTMQTYGLGYIITREAFDDNQYDDLSVKYTKALKRSMMKTKEIRGASVLNNGFSGSFLGGDGVALFSDSHPLKSGGTFDNLGTAADLAEGPLQAAITDIGAWVDERGLLVNVKVEKMIVANGGQFQAARLLESPGRIADATATAGYFSDLNVAKHLALVPQGYRVNHYLTDPDAWFLKTDADEGLILFDRAPLRVEEGEGFDNQVMKVIATERYAFGFANPRGAWGNAGA